MGMIRKEVTGSAESLKLVKNAKTAPKTPKGGTQRTSFTGSSDNRKAGDVSSNIGPTMTTAPGYIDQGPVMADMSKNHGASFVNEGKKGGMTPKYSSAREDVTKGMGGKVIKDMG